MILPGRCRHGVLIEVAELLPVGEADEASGLISRYNREFPVDGGDEHGRCPTGVAPGLHWSNRRSCVIQPLGNANGLLADVVVDLLGEAGVAEAYGQPVGNDLSSVSSVATRARASGSKAKPLITASRMPPLRRDAHRLGALLSSAAKVAAPRRSRNGARVVPDLDLWRGHAFLPEDSVLGEIPRLHETESVLCVRSWSTCTTSPPAGATGTWPSLRTGRAHRRRRDPPHPANRQAGQPELSEDRRTAFGYVNLGDPQNAEWGYMDLNELRDLLVHVRGMPLYVERDLHWTPKPLLG